MYFPDASLKNRVIFQISNFQDNVLHDSPHTFLLHWWTRIEWWPRNSRFLQVRSRRTYRTSPDINPFEKSFHLVVGIWTVIIEYPIVVCSGEFQLIAFSECSPCGVNCDVGGSTLHFPKFSTFFVASTQAGLVPVLEEKQKVTTRLHDLKNKKLMLKELPTNNELSCTFRVPKSTWSHGTMVFTVCIRVLTSSSISVCRRWQTSLFTASFTSKSFVHLTRKALFSACWTHGRTRIQEQASPGPIRIMWAHRSGCLLCRQISGWI